MPTYRGQQGVAIHIGLNKVDPDCYGGWNGALKGCINDARSMEAITSGLDYSVTTLLDEDATAQAVLDAITGSADSLSSGDILVLTYSGHGGQVQDTSGDESDSQDETWVCYDRMVLDDELYQAFQEIPEGVRIFMLSDSCHSGTVAKATLAVLAGGPHIPIKNAAPINYSNFRVKAIPIENLGPAYKAQQKKYDKIQKTFATTSKAKIGASVVLISGCMDNQVSLDGAKNGLFTETLLKVYNGGTFTGTLRSFHQAILDQMPFTQSPNYFVTGSKNAKFESSAPFAL